MHTTPKQKAQLLINSYSRIISRRWVYVPHHPINKEFTLFPFHKNSIYKRLGMICAVSILARAETGLLAEGEAVSTPVLFFSSNSFT
jgi:hypothetical protein